MVFGFSVWYVTWGNFLEFHDTRFKPKKMQDLEVKCRSVGSLAQFESLYTCKENLYYTCVGESKKSCVMMPLRYHKILLIAVQWDSNWDVVNWHDLFTLKRAEVSCLLCLYLVSLGEVTQFTLHILAQERRSRIYIV